jgi:hypothetical protein
MTARPGRFHALLRVNQWETAAARMQALECGHAVQSVRQRRELASARMDATYRQMQALCVPGVALDVGGYRSVQDRIASGAEQIGRLGVELAGCEAALLEQQRTLAALRHKRNVIERRAEAIARERRQILARAETNVVDELWLTLRKAAE